ncbi:MAG: hypothetical protein V1934_00415 [Methanobacteriota archaeon]
MKKNDVPKRPIYILEAPGAIKILLALYQEDPLEKSLPITMSLSELSEVIDCSNSTINLRLKDLINAGLIKDDYSTEGHRKRMIYLTPRGIRVAHDLDFRDGEISGYSGFIYDPPKFYKKVR